MTLIDVAFSDGDFVVRDGDFVLIRDNAAIIQAADLQLRLQLGLNQYFEDAGWDWMRWLHATVAPSDVDDIVAQIKLLLEGVSDVIRADVVARPILDDELSFDIDITTSYGTETLLYTIGGTLVHR